MPDEMTGKTSELTDLDDGQPAEEGSDEVLFQHPTWKDQILSVPADKADEFESAGYEKVSGEENKAKAVEAGRANRYHFST